MVMENTIYTDPKQYASYKQLMRTYIQYQYQENAPLKITDEILEMEYQMLKGENTLHYVLENWEFYSDL
ncbi:hypothetical protein MATR_09840 [Marivirga tractuosa]|uniref:Uncharacterized protein n=2 Tax=Marivirga TaxID=869806 RepID=E4TMV6_MARTH|nr:hypothetical protein Ftrac_1397 [Marivirga tractuosa DSM 4126]BDD14159.1 hypothetical protein MATR_09840 [Marivirga tractuosa]